LQVCKWRFAVVLALSSARGAMQAVWGQQSALFDEVTHRINASVEAGPWGRGTSDAPIGEAIPIVGTLNR